MNKEVIAGCPFCGSHKVDICRTNEHACWVRCVPDSKTPNVRAKRADTAPAMPE